MWEEMNTESNTRWLDDLKSITFARDTFAMKGGARGVAEDSQGRICATYAICQTERTYDHVRLVHIVNIVSREMFGKSLIRVNDTLGIEAVLQVFDKTIAHLAEQA